MARPENMMAFNAITEEFLAKHLGGRVEPIGEDVFDSSAQVRNKGNLALAGLPVWANDGTVVTRPERAPVDEGALTEEQLMQVSMALKQIESFPPQQLPNLLADLERRRAEVPESDLPVFDYMVQQIEAMMEAETRKADASATP